MHIDVVNPFNRIYCPLIKDIENIENSESDNEDVFNEEDA